LTEKNGDSKMVSSPTISVNKLGEYILSRGARQRQILKERKYPDEEFSPGMYHREASEAVAEYLANGALDPEPLTKQLQILAQITTQKVGTARRINANIDALERFSEMLDDIDLLEAEPNLGAHKSPKLTYHNVEISVRPEIVLRGVGAKGKKLVGTIKLHFAKTHPHNEESAGYVSAAMQEYCRLHLAADDEIVNPAYCQVIDVASGKIFPGVKATAQRLKDIAAECQNIAGLWPTI
jgi:hypothetical protein